MTKTEYIIACENEKMPKIKVGDYHKHADIWAVTVNNRVFCRQATKNVNGWYSALLNNPEASLKLSHGTVNVLGKPPKDNEALTQKINRAYIKKYGYSFSWLAIIARLITRKKHAKKTIELISNQ